MKLLRGAPSFLVALLCLLGAACGDGSPSEQDAGPTEDAGATEDAEPLPADSAPIPDGAPTPPDGPAGRCTAAADLLDPAECGGGETCTVVNPDGTLGCINPGTIGFYEACTNLGECVAGSGCFGMTTAELRCAPYCQLGGEDTCPRGGACTMSFPTSNGSIGLCTRSAVCDIVDGTGCSGELACYVGDTHGTALCTYTGTTAEGESCTISNDCIPGTVCSGPGDKLCHKLCYGDGDCLGTDTCTGQGLAFSAAPSVGICLP